MDKLEEMGKSLERFNIPGVTKEIANMNIPNTSTEIESVIKKLPTKKSQGSDNFTGKFYQLSREEFATNLLKLFQKIAEEGALSNPLHNATIQFSSVHFSRSVVSDSLRPHELLHARLPCPSPTPGVHQTHVHQVSDVIQPSHPLSSPSPPAPNPS